MMDNNKPKINHTKVFLSALFNAVPLTLLFYGLCLLVFTPYQALVIGLYILISKTLTIWKFLYQDMLTITSAKLFREFNEEIKVIKNKLKNLN